jgi:hypothetical protein
VSGRPPIGLRTGARRLLAGVACVSLLAGCGRPQAASPIEPLAPAPTVVPVVIDPVVPGWSPVRSEQRAAAYDVPPSWHVFTESTIIGYEIDSGKRVAASGAADIGAGACGSKDASLAVAAIKHDTGSDLARASEGTAREWADLAYRDDKERPPRLTVRPPESITTLGGKPAVLVKVEVRTASPAGACKLKEGAVYATSATGFTGELGPTAILVVVADVGVPGAVRDADIRRILTTLRPV